MVPSSNLIRAMRGPRSGFVAGWNEVGALICGAGLWCGWLSLNRGRRGAGIFPPFAPFAAFQDDAAIFGHTRPAGFYPILYQQFCDDGIGRIFAPQFHDGVMERFQIVERDATWVGCEILNRLTQRFKIGC